VDFKSSLKKSVFKFLRRRQVSHSRKNGGPLQGQNKEGNSNDVIIALLATFLDYFVKLWDYVHAPN